jgi:hypothetical protein
LFNWLKTWKPIHLCWWFEKHSWKIPKYFIGGAPEQYQTHYKTGKDDNADPDLGDWNELDTENVWQKETNFMIRIQVVDVVADSAEAVWNLYVNTVDNPSSATQVTTISTPVQLADGTPADGTDLDDKTVVYDADTEDGLSWTNGEYSESDDTDKQRLYIDNYTDFQWCIKFLAAAEDDTTYYFYVRRAGSEIDGYTTVARAKTPASTSKPRGPLGHPFHGPFGGPI